MTHSAFKCVQSASIFQGLSDDDIAALAKISVHQQLFPKGTVLYAPTTLLDRMMIIDQGQVKVYQLNENGKEKILYMLRPGSIDSEAALFTQRPHYNYAEAVEDTRICSIGSHDFQGLVKRVPTLALNLLNALGDRLTALESMSALTSNLGSKERLLTYLQQVSQENQQTHFRLPVKKKELASYLGVTPETLSRQFKLLAEDQLISVDGREITVY
ncbi:Crp/Fnr family transcriptional regulator [Lactiplantibacillus paraxiangfangensis]|uniref:Crp/Fnr family transcriptional regulator n=1 Tax=Lactiplantibacillus paraxiangfangensis TaxID=3076224 RepID=UPI0030C66370